MYLRLNGACLYSIRDFYKLDVERSVNNQHPAVPNAPAVPVQPGERKTTAQFMAEIRGMKKTKRVPNAVRGMSRGNPYEESY